MILVYILSKLAKELHKQNIWWVRDVSFAFPELKDHFVIFIGNEGNIYILPKIEKPIKVVLK